MPIVADPAAYIPDQVCQVDLSMILWRATGAWLGEGVDSCARLTATVQVGGADHFLEAIEVTEIDGVQVGADGAEDALEELDAFAGGGDGPLETVSIEGRSYALFLTPFRR